ncbi:MAG TPA: hypothetical protein VJC08_05850, partial [bacterium]|nr:hypothetical protein [bacterium]
MRQKRPAVIGTGYYPAIGKDIEVPVEAFNPKVLAGVDILYANKKSIKVTLGGKSITLKPEQVEIPLKDGTVIKASKFKVTAGNTQVVLYGGDAKVLTPDVLPETQKGYDLLFTSGGPGLKAAAYRKAMETLRPEGVAIVDFLAADFVEDTYRVFDEMRGLEISEGEAFLSPGSSQSASSLFTVWKKLNPPETPKAAENANSTREIFFNHPVWKNTPDAYGGFLQIAVKSQNPEIQKRAEEAVLERIQGDQTLLKKVLERMEINPDIPELLVLSRIALRGFELYRDKGIPKDYGRLFSSAIRYVGTSPVYKDILENIAKAQAILSARRS